MLSYRMVLTYRLVWAEILRITKKLEKELRTVQRTTEHQMIDVTLRDRKVAVSNREQLQVAGILAKIKRKRRSSAGHVMC